MEAEPAAQQDRPAARHSLAGAGLHLKDDAGLIKRQATIVDVFPSGNINIGDLALIQYFDWTTGDPAIRGLVPVHELAGEKWVLYGSVEEMRDHFERVDKPRAEAAEREKAAAEQA